jgi:hypothetical protein
VAVWTVMLALCAGALAAPAARGENPGSLPNWPELLPPSQQAGSNKVRLAFDACRRGGKRCPGRVIREMRERWGPLDASCDHRAVFALTYLRTTEEFASTIEGDPDFFTGRRWIRHEDAVFAQLYFRAYDRHARGRSVPEAWRIAFESAASPNVTGIGDLLLGMNAHINRDLPYTLAHVGLRRRNGEPRKRDHDKVNVFLDRVIDPLQVELARRYDPSFQVTDAEPSPLDEVGALQAVRGFRENAWRNAERLVEARSEQELAAVRASIEAEAATIAQTIRATNTVPMYGPTVRDPHCRV